MNADRLLAVYDRVVEAPDSVSRLRRYVLDLAIRGKLVDQDPANEPASELLKRIAVEKARLVKAGEIRKPKAIVPLDPDKYPFPVPKRWAWTQMAELGVISPRNEAPDDHEASFVPMSMIAAEYGVGNNRTPRLWGEIKKGYTHFAEGDVGLAKITPCFENGKSTVFRNLTGGIGSGTTELHVVRPLFVDADYLVLFLKSPHFIETGISKMTGTAGQKRVPTGYFTSSPVPLPPVAEQRRIVAKVEELMALCDRLEAARTTREATRDRLTAASLARLTAPDTDAGTFRTHARFALDAFPALTTRPDQIKTLRQTILNLAVRGKLVEQDRADEPASDLLERIVNARKRQVIGRKIRGAKPPPPPSEDEEGFALPDTWELCCLGQVSIITDPNPSHRYPDYSGGTVPILSTREFFGESGWNAETAKLTTKSFWRFQKELCAYSGGDIVFARKGRLGIPRFLPDIDRFTFSHTLFVIKPMSGLYPEYLLWLLRRDEAVDWLTNEMNQNTGVPTLGKAKMEKLPVPLPPFDEQRRIVAKVDTLMFLCNGLETGLHESDTTRQRLLDALLHEALQAEAITPASEALEAAG
jgi:type I restriction enzyme S subunit